jgi:hypothetical protein
MNLPHAIADVPFDADLAAASIFPQPAINPKAKKIIRDEIGFTLSSGERAGVTAGVYLPLVFASIARNELEVLI